MARKFTKDEIINRLRKEVDAGRPIIGSGSSTGIVAKCAEIGGADLIIVYSTGLSRSKGLPTSGLGLSNPMTLDMYDEISNVVQDTPIICGIDANDLTNLYLEKLLKKFLNKGFDGMINFPTVGFAGHERRKRMAEATWAGNVGWPDRKHPMRGWAREVEMIKLCNEWEVFSMVYVFNNEDAIEMAKAGTDLICAHVGGTRGGLTGFPGRDYEEACKVGQGIIDAARSVNPDILCVVHGGPFAEPKDTKVLYERTNSQGFVGASSMERIPIERAVINCLKEFKSHSTKR